MTKRLDPGLVARAVAQSSLEWKLTDPLAFALPASPLQRAVARIADGRPLGELARDASVIRALGDVDACPALQPRELTILSGIRTGKSLLAACLAVHWALSCDVSRLREGEIPRVSVVSLKKDLADVVLNHVVGSTQSSPLFRRLLIGDPDGEGIVLRHPTGRPVEIKVVAGSRAGSSLVSRWSAGCIFDEFPRMTGADDAVVNWDDSRQAVLLRLLPGSQLVHIGSPWAPYGPAYELVTERWGKPSANHVVVRAPAWDMNPGYWTSARVEEAKRADPDAYRTDVLAEFASPEESLFSAESIDRAMRRAPVVVPPKPGNTYYAAMDPATRGNGWTMAIATREGGRTIVVRVDEWMGTRNEPLDPAMVLGEAAAILGAYGVRTVHSDQVMGDALVALGRQVGLSVVQWRLQSRERAEKYLAIRTRMDLGEIELPPVQRLRTDLLHLRKRVTPGGMDIQLPQTSDGRHCDYAPTLMLVLSRVLPEPQRQEKRAEDNETALMRQKMIERFCRPKEEW